MAKKGALYKGLWLELYGVHRRCMRAHTHQIYKLGNQ